MIDIHSHIIPNVDDGAQTALETFIMLKQAEKAGFTDIIATPHYMEQSIEQDKNDILQKIDEINEAATQQGIKVKLHAGEEIYAMPNLVEVIKNNKIISVKNSNYILIEFAMHDKPKFLENVIFETCNYGYIPIIAHPERYDYVKKDISLVGIWQNMGALIQCNYGSLIGKYGSSAKKIVNKLLKSKQVDFMGTDCHKPGSIYDEMEDSIKKLKKVVDDNYFELITTTNAKKILIQK